jgi:hypothetical protein
VGIIHGRVDLVPQGREVIRRKLTDQKCTACWDEKSQGSRRPDCRYCKGEGYMFRESFVKMAFFRGMAPVYKPGVQATGQYPGSDWGYSDPDRATAFCEYTVFPDYERYTLQTNPAFDKLYELKVDSDGQTVRPIIRSGKWKVMNVSRSTETTDGLSTSKHRVQT